MESKTNANNTFLSSQIEGDCGCNGNMNSRLQDNINSNLMRLNDKDYAQHLPSLYDPDSNMGRRNESPVNPEKLLSQMDGNTSMTQLGNFRVLARDFADLPQVEGDVLAFRDPEQFSSYYQYLEDMTNYVGKSAFGLSQEGFFDSIEKKIGFLSLRKVTNEAFAALAQEGWERFEEIPEIHFITDMLFRSFLSPSGEMKIGSYVTRFINENVAVSVSSFNSELRSLVKQLGKETTLAEVKAIEMHYPNDFRVDEWNIQNYPADISNDDRIKQTDGLLPTNIVLKQNGADNEGVLITQASSRLRVLNPSLDSGNLKTDSWVPYVPKPQYNTDVQGTPTNKPTALETKIHTTVGVNDCTGEVNITYVLLEYREDALFAKQYSWHEVSKVGYIVDWGDGEKTILSARTFNSHTYKDPGNYTISIYAYSSGGTLWSSMPPLVKSTAVNVLIGCGVGANKEGERWAERADGYRKIRGTHKIQQYKSGFGTITNGRAVARTEAFHWEKDFWGRWRWRQFNRNKVYVYMRFDKYSKDACHFEGNFPYHADDIGWEVEVHASQKTFFGWKYILSKHELFSYPNVIIEEFVTRRC